MAALNVCPMCGKSVPRGADACPECGEKRPVTGRKLSYLEMPHSGPGLASFGFALLGWITLVGTFGFTAFVVQGRSPAQPPIAIGVAAIAGMALLSAGIVLGLVGVLLPNRKKVFAILGLVFSLLPVVSCGGLIALGLLLAAGAK